MTTYYVGTAGWSYEDWEGIVYPPDKPRGFHPLPFLARLIDIVEINSTFYRPASAYMAMSWLRKVEAFPSFLFAVKLHQVFTHKRNAFGQKDVDEFRAGIDPLNLRGAPGRRPPPVPLVLSQYGREPGPPGPASSRCSRNTPWPSRSATPRGTRRSSTGSSRSTGSPSATSTSPSSRIASSRRP